MLTSSLTVSTFDVCFDPGFCNFLALPWKGFFASNLFSAGSYIVGLDVFEVEVLRFGLLYPLVVSLVYLFLYLSKVDLWLV